MGFKLITVDSGQSITLKPWDGDQSTYTMVYVRCFSMRCPAWIITDKKSKTVRVDGRRTMNQNAQGMYMYSYEYRDANNDLKAS